MELLPTIWFILIAVLWIGYLLLEGFDLGVGMHIKIFAKTEKEKRLILNTIGPVWDGNEVWLLTAAGATFAAFPYWYASLFSSLYIPLVLVLAGLIFRAVSFEYRGKVDNDSWRKRWDWAISIGSAVSSFGIGVMLSLTTTGLPINENGDRVGGPFAWLNIYAVIGGLAFLCFCLAHSWIFLALKTDGSIRERSRISFKKYSPFMILPLIIWVLKMQLDGGNTYSFILMLFALFLVLFSWVMNLKIREGWSFLGFSGFLICSISAIFSAAYPVILPSTIDVDYSLTIYNASSSAYTLKLMTIVSLFGLPIILAYQSWTYWVFRQRLKVDNIPDPKPVPVAIKK